MAGAAGTVFPFFLLLALGLILGVTETAGAASTGASGAIWAGVGTTAGAAPPDSRSTVPESVASLHSATGAGILSSSESPE